MEMKMRVPTRETKMPTSMSITRLSAVAESREMASELLEGLRQLFVSWLPELPW